MSATSGKEKRLLAQAASLGIHVDGPTLVLTDEQEAEFLNDPEMMACCYGAAVYGPSRCTCWEPVYSEERHAPTGGVMAGREEQCVDCAFRHDSAEFQDAEGREFLESIVATGEPFICHQGMAYTVEWRHPSGRVLPMTVDEVGSIHTWEPLYREGVPAKADGSPADLCAGWLARRLREAQGAS